MKARFVALFFIVGAFTACERKEPLPNLPIPSLSEVRLIDGRLHFPSQEQFDATRLAINRPMPIDVSEWQSKIGFHSMKMTFDAIQRDFEQVENRVDYQRFQEQHQDYLWMTPDSSVSIKGYHPFLSALLNINGEVSIANFLVKYTNTHIIRIEDSSEEKLAQAQKELISDEKNGIWVVPRRDMEANLVNSRYCHPNDIWHTLHGYSGVEHRIYAYYNVDNKTSQLSYSVLINAAPMEVKSYFNVHIKSQYRGFLNYWYRKRTTITWNVGWGVEANDKTKSPNFGHGTGGTVGNVSEINYSYDIRPNGLLIYWNEKSDNDYRFDYCSSYLQTPLMSGSKSCPR
ncbi:hypothetical protein [Aureispira sp. CCB-QB1]|uniref:hypothetical protein n=1 Tax=Aureispira sp. CCB-QB1 TaxID=1313421 RepID=UPI000698D975|nr:hypothetical protein [Aureispira sp. CCB-QB1]